MLKILDVDKTVNLRELNHSSEVFHNALGHVLNGETRFRVINDKGQNYDLLYVNNQEWASSSDKYPETKLFDRYPMYPPYLVYDEDDVSKICLDIFEGCKGVWFEKICEYSIVLARVILENTELNVYFADERINWFIQDSDRLTVAQSIDGKDSLLVYEDYIPSPFIFDYSKMDVCALFHHVFFLQWLTPLKLSDVKYIELIIPKTEGIGSILIGFGKIKSYLEKFGFPIVIKPDSLRYSDKLMHKYFGMKGTPCEANDENTIRIINYYSILSLKMIWIGNVQDTPIISGKLQEEIEEYTNAVFKDQKILGILLRGSDYVTNHMFGGVEKDTVESAIPIIRQWFEIGHYDKIFLATEDRDIIKTMCEAFPGKIRAVSQERYSVTDFSDTITTINELDRKNHPGDEYDEFVEDVTINYLYAVYMLSRCESFMYSCHCAGVALVYNLNQNSFKKRFCFATNREE